MDKLPGAIYSLLVAIAAWLVDYLTTGDGAGIPWAPIVIATVPIALQYLRVYILPDGEEPAPEAQARGSGHTPPRSKSARFLWG
jgi:hypothetical protein